MSTLKHLPFLLVIFMLASCGKTEFTKKHQAKWKANSVQYTCDPDNVVGSYDAGDPHKLNITANASAGQADLLSMQIDLTKTDQDVLVLRPLNHFTYTPGSGANTYQLINGHYKITSYSEGDPSSRHVEGTFTIHFDRDQNASDTVNLSEGYFYLNNY
ncbi:MAG: hypothetical protein JST83_15985 [Bacteroidetes bacterium]|nr:hypothetical protein [Bacteroidota bacterium]